MRVHYENDSMKLAVIGDPISHSLSPVLQNTMIDALDLNCIYLAQRVAPYQVSDWISAATLMGFGGFNATMPHKVNLVPFMETLSPDARMYGAVNTVVIRNRACHGYNTDGAGFLQSLVDEQVHPKGQRIAILGAGGAARSVVLKLVQAGAERVTVCCRNPVQGKELHRLKPGVINVASMDPAELRLVLKDSGLLVNCTPLGMHEDEQNFADLSFLDALPKRAVVCDTIYNPEETFLLAQARSRGHLGINGIGMLIHQGIFSLELFADVTIDSSSVMPAVRQAIAKAIADKTPK